MTFFLIFLFTNSLKFEVLIQLKHIYIYKNSINFNNFINNLTHINTHTNK